MTGINPSAIIARYIPNGSPLFEIYSTHTTMVARKAVAAGRALGLSDERLLFVEQAALLHDIGIVYVHCPEIYCHGSLPYLQHGIEGRRMLEAEGLFAHALVAENHVGVGIRRDEIIHMGLSLPPRDMLPQSTEEKLVCWADLFFSKTPDRLRLEKPLAAVRQSVAKYGPAPLARFEALHALCAGHTP